MLLIIRHKSDVTVNTHKAGKLGMVRNGTSLTGKGVPASGRDELANVPRAILPVLTGCGTDLS